MPVETQAAVSQIQCKDDKLFLNLDKLVEVRQLRLGGNGARGTEIQRNRSNSLLLHL